MALGASFVKRYGHARVVPPSEINTATLELANCPRMRMVAFLKNTHTLCLTNCPRLHTVCRCPRLRRLELERSRLPVLYSEDKPAGVAGWADPAWAQVEALVIVHPPVPVEPYVARFSRLTHLTIRAKTTTPNTRLTLPPTLTQLDIGDWPDGRVLLEHGLPRWLRVACVGQIPATRAPGAPPPEYLCVLRHTSTPDADRALDDAFRGVQHVCIAGAAAFDVLGMRQRPGLRVIDLADVSGDNAGPFVVGGFHGLRSLRLIRCSRVRVLADGLDVLEITGGSSGVQVIGRVRGRVECNFDATNPGDVPGCTTHLVLKNDVGVSRIPYARLPVLHTLILPDDACAFVVVAAGLPSHIKMQRR